MTTVLDRRRIAGMDVVVDALTAERARGRGLSRAWISLSATAAAGRVKGAAGPGFSRRASWAA